STLQPTPFFGNGGTQACDHTVSAGQTDAWTVAAHSAAGTPALTASGLPGFATFTDAGAGQGNVSFAPNADAASAAIAFTITATVAGLSATLNCTEHVVAVPKSSTITGTVNATGAAAVRRNHSPVSGSAPLAGVTVTLSGPGGIQVRITDAS